MAKKKKNYTLENEILVDFNGVFKVNMDDLNISQYTPAPIIKEKIAKYIAEVFDESCDSVSPILMDVSLIESTVQSRSVLRTSDEEDLSSE